MRILLRAPQLSEGADKLHLSEYHVIELQGDLETKDSDPLTDKLIGDLHFTKDGTPLLIIGHHILYGKVVKFDKPLLVLRKNRSGEITLDPNESLNTSLAATENTASTEYNVEGIIRSRILFKSRPKPIISNGPWPDDLFASPLLTPPTPELCQLLVDYSDCLRATSRSCRGQLDYHTILHVIERWEKEHDCSSVLTKAEEWSFADVANHCKWKPQSLRLPISQDLMQDPPFPVFSHCAFFGHTHLMTFKGDVHTCSLEGAWPILDNEFVAIQVTTRVSERRSVACAATVATTVSVVIKAYKDCTSQMSYEGSVTSLPASFIGGHLHGGKERASMIREVIPGKHVEILLAHAGTVIVIRRAGQANYLNVAVRVPSQMTGEENHTREQLPVICTKGCPKSNRLALRFDDPNKEGILETCRAFQVTDLFLDACVFDVIASEDSQLSEASFNAQNDLWSLSPEVAVGALPNRSYLLVSSPLQSRCSHPVVPSFCCLLLTAFLSVLFQSAVT
ncbi:unnamed protein product [Cyprideis torosa]|uniref:Uncharacterized protein n=1 Tax=Cyprideis torosa TaxID=163714 RepID=A0A7R8WHL0_9CRUS|nr:unnamed protein product [Cyprideis torosa]CAG0897689.1 unnamed protein product [Cyprideis torosa]